MKSHLADAVLVFSGTTLEVFPAGAAPFIRLASFGTDSGELACADVRFERTLHAVPSEVNNVFSSDCALTVRFRSPSLVLVACSSSASPR